MSAQRENELKKLVNDLLRNVYQTIDREYGFPILPQNEKWNSELEEQYATMLNDCIRQSLWTEDSTSQFPDRVTFKSTCEKIRNIVDVTLTVEYDVYRAYVTTQTILTDGTFYVRVICNNNTIGAIKYKVRDNGVIFNVSSDITKISEIVIKTLNFDAYSSSKAVEFMFNKILEEVITLRSVSHK